MSCSRNVAIRRCYMKHPRRLKFLRRTSVEDEGPTLRAPCDSRGLAAARYPARSAKGVGFVHESRLPDLTARLIAVGEANYGTYSWQRTHDAYTVFVAEYFLRRSNRTTVERYLPAFLERFPDAASLASTEPDVVLERASWAGMRTRTMHLPAAVAAFVALDRPTAAALEEIPHVGPYAASAIALYAFGEPVFPVDGNVKRVVSRWLDLADGAELLAATRAIATEAQKVGGPSSVMHAHFGALTIGWTNCRTRRRCDGCRLSSSCMSSSTSTHDGGT